LDCALPFPEDWVHDEWLAICASAVGNVEMLEEKLTAYRQHRNNTIGVPLTEFSRLVNHAIKVTKISRGEYFDYKIRRLDALITRLQADSAVSAEKFTLLDEARDHFVQRANFDDAWVRRIAPVLREYRAGGYRRFADGVAGMIRDLILF
jgi:hypothetical protein